MIGMFSSIGKSKDGNFLTITYSLALVVAFDVGRADLLLSYGLPCFTIRLNSHCTCAMNEQASVYR